MLKKYSRMFTALFAGLLFLAAMASDGGSVPTLPLGVISVAATAGLLMVNAALSAPKKRRAVKRTVTARTPRPVQAAPFVPADAKTAAPQRHTAA